MEEGLSSEFQLWPTWLRLTNFDAEFLLGSPLRTDRKLLVSVDIPSVNAGAILCTTLPVVTDILWLTLCSDDQLGPRFHRKRPCRNLLYSLAGRGHAAKGPGQNGTSNCWLGRRDHQQSSVSWEPKQRSTLG
jgi:hypothetical protein